jgi:hexokinase
MAANAALMDRLRPFSLTRPQLEEVRESLRERITVGLERNGTEVKALPAYLPAPDRSLKGRALVIDIGGTNVRGAVVELIAGSRSRIVSGPLKEPLPVRHHDRGLSGDAFFALQANIAQGLTPPLGLPVGYCFSYPSEILPNREGRLISWTKGLDVPGVVGTLVGSRLHSALARAGLEPREVRVLNDTVSSMLGGAFSTDQIEPSQFIGLIVGTGTNMATFFDPERVPKLGLSAGCVPMAINLESGNFTPPHLTAYDDLLDSATDNPGKQRLEKAVSGHYLPLLFELILPSQPGFDPRRGSGPLVEYRDKGLEDDPLEVAEALLSRSADLVAAGLAAVIDLHPSRSPIGILAEGSLFWGDSKYGPRVSATLATLLGSPDRARIIRLEDANLIGGACAALCP